MLLIITSTGDVLFGGINVNDFEPQKRGFSDFFLRFLAAEE